MIDATYRGVAAIQAALSFLVMCIHFFKHFCLPTHLPYIFHQLSNSSLMIETDCGGVTS
uniref:Uncharacterized protein n=1 Tax=Siphoviridae sp. ctKwY15 TaxID=2827843 RepID=A0A8S5STS5_9CAUD|nr:MAG TPA: hypothetical protein [Siphoviridae sp. ctKwY15]